MSDEAMRNDTEYAPKTWSDLEKAAFGDTTNLGLSVVYGNPVLRQAVEVVRAGFLTKEQALLAIVLHYAEASNEWIRMEVERRSLEMPTPFIIKKVAPMLLLLCLLPSLASAGPLRIPSAVFVGVNTLDIVSTQRALTVPGAYEVNPLGQSAGARVAVKAASTAGVLWIASKVQPKHPKLAAGLLWASSAIVGVAVLNNARIAR